MKIGNFQVNTINFKLFLFIKMMKIKNQQQFFLYPDQFSWIFLSYMEPNAEINWIKLHRLIPHAVRVHGVTGFDQAHQMAAKLAVTEWFFTLDGDSTVDENWLKNPNSLSNIAFEQNSAWCWRAQNVINGLTYGNGGVKLWHRDFALGLNSHSSGSVDFCWHNQYRNVNQVAGTTDPGHTALQAFCAGAREGVKLLLQRGEWPGKSYLQTNWHPLNQICWLTWCVRGQEKPQTHWWATFGARWAALEQINLPSSKIFDKINSLNELKTQFEYFHKNLTEKDKNFLFNDFGEKLNQCLGKKIIPTFSSSFQALEFFNWLDQCYENRANV